MMDRGSDKGLEGLGEVMMEKIKEVEEKWEKGWLGIKGGGVGENMEGRR